MEGRLLDDCSETFPAFFLIDAFVVPLRTYLRATAVGSLSRVGDTCNESKLLEIVMFFRK
jgi:hypothetical protein